jgi:hypothetical protein
VEAQGHKLSKATSDLIKSYEKREWRILFTSQGRANKKKFRLFMHGKLEIIRLK